MFLPGLGIRLVPVRCFFLMKLMELSVPTSRRKWAHPLRVRGNQQGRSIPTKDSDKYSAYKNLDLTTFYRRCSLLYRKLHAGDKTYIQSRNFQSLKVPLHTDFFAGDLWKDFIIFKLRSNVILFEFFNTLENLLLSYHLIFCLFSCLFVQIAFLFPQNICTVHKQRNAIIIRGVLHFPKVKEYLAKKW